MGVMVCACGCRLHIAAQRDGPFGLHCRQQAVARHPAIFQWAYRSLQQARQPWPLPWLSSSAWAPPKDLPVAVAVPPLARLEALVPVPVWRVGEIEQALLLYEVGSLDHNRFILLHWSWFCCLCYGCCSC